MVTYLKKYQNVLIKNGWKFMINLVMQIININQAKKYDLKNQCFCNYSDAYTVVKGTITVRGMVRDS